MLLKTKAIVLQTIKHGDTSLIVKLYTRERGCLSYIVNGVRSPKSKFKASLFMPLNILEIETHYKAVQQLQRFTEARCDYPFTEIHFHPIKSGVCLFLQEVLNKVLRYEDVNSTLFDFIESSLKLLDHLDSSIKFFHIQMLLKMSSHLGYSFVEYGDRQSGYNWSIPSQEFKMLEELKTLSLGEYPEQNASVKPLLDITLKFYAKNIDDFLPLKSLEVLHEVYQ